MRPHNPRKALREVSPQPLLHVAEPSLHADPVLLWDQAALSLELRTGEGVVFPLRIQKLALHTSWLLGKLYK